MSASKFTRGPDGKTRRKRGHGPKFVQLFWYVVDSPTWRDMSGSEVKAYVAVARRFNGMNNGTIGMSARELADEIGCSKSEASRLLVKLVARGLLEVVTRSAFSLKIKRATEYRLTVYPCDKTRKAATWTANSAPPAPSDQKKSFHGPKATGHTVPELRDREAETGPSQSQSYGTEKPKISKSRSQSLGPHVDVPCLSGRAR